MSIGNMVKDLLLSGAKAYIKKKMPHLTDEQISAGISEAAKMASPYMASKDVSDLAKVKAEVERSYGIKDSVLRQALNKLPGALQGTALGAVPGLSGFLAKAGESILGGGQNNAGNSRPPSQQQPRWKSLPALKPK